MNLRSIVCICLMLFATKTNLKAQVNVKIGYNLNYFQSAEQVSITNAFNQEISSQVNLEKELRPLHWMNGLDLGISFKREFTRAEIYWRTLLRGRDVLGESKDPIALYNNDVRYTMQGIHASYSVVLKRFEAGVTLGRDLFSMRTSIAGSNNDKTITSQALWNYGIKLSCLLSQNDHLSLYLSPYMNTSINSLNYDEIATHYGLSRESSVGHPVQFGVSLIFYNGRQ